MKSISKHAKLNVLAIAIASVFSANAMSATDPEALAAAIAKQEAELTALKSQLQQLAQQQKQQEIEVQQQQTEHQQELQAVKSTTSKWDKFSFKSYGSAIYTSDEYFDNVQDTSPERRSRFDLERIVTEFGYQFNDEWDMEVEIEYEHGGTGTSLEYDGFDEFGEFEAEVEAGGEVMIEKAEIRYRPSKAFGVKFGNIHLPVGLSSTLHKPSQYLTVQRHKSEAAMLPAVWNENGIGIFGEMADFHYQAQVVSGLNSEYFRTYDWVASGHQKRFEHVNADDLAYVLRLDYGNFKTGSAIGASYYYGNTSGNRHKTNKLSSDGTVEILSVAGAFVEGPWTLRGQYLYGTLSDSDAITQANKTTPGLKPGNFAQLGSKSEAFFVEAGVDLGHFTPVPITIFANIDYSNPLKEVETGVATKRYENTWISAGINYFPIPEVVIKAEAGVHQVAVAAIPDTNFFALGVGYQFSL
ncbi:OprO/OprP family phosphate-selective porin [Shewanella marinintestina]|uniref:OprO/OprP family phosphate-selective porin n=1 Tax=Shewanella marinintestina TaxID=190305 RepID=UPI00200F3C6D|nr:OprO/OprP family phosphate-selective porin [Shewanella marinintestina]MCL1146263.1 OprO/OprP family phosphate-selective porin [Shewanella marinintestina]